MAGVDRTEQLEKMAGAKSLLEMLVYARIQPLPEEVESKMATDIRASNEARAAESNTTIAKNVEAVPVPGWDSPNSNGYYLFLTPGKLANFVDDRYADPKYRDILKNPAAVSVFLLEESKETTNGLLPSRSFYVGLYSSSEVTEFFASTDPNGKRTPKRLTDSFIKTTDWPEELDVKFALLNGKIPLEDPR